MKCRHATANVSLVRVTVPALGSVVTPWRVRTKTAQVPGADTFAFIGNSSSHSWQILAISSILAISADSVRNS